MSQKRQEGRNTADAPRAKKSLGQNFLQDANIARKIVRALDISSDDGVVEIGPGPGALTEIIASYSPRKLVLIEKDVHWAFERMRQGQGRLNVILADALTLHWEGLPEGWKCIGNLPYNVASSLMWELFSRAAGLSRAVFMIQKEVGQRLVAKPGTSAYGALSVWVQSFVRPKLEFIVPPHVFRPRPKVDSAVVSFTPIPAAERLAQAFAPSDLSDVLKACFQMRRKQLGTIAKNRSCDIGVLEKMGINPQVRPEELSPEIFHRLATARFFLGKH